MRRLLLRTQRNDRRSARCAGGRRAQRLHLFRSMVDYWEVVTFVPRLSRPSFAQGKCALAAIRKGSGLSTGKRGSTTPCLDQVSDRGSEDGRDPRYMEWSPKPSESRLLPAVMPAMPTTPAPNRAHSSSATPIWPSVCSDFISEGTREKGRL
jgi:hypothetical protein